MQPGHILHPLCIAINRAIDWLPPAIYLHLRKPLTECLFCMSSVWGIVFTLQYAAFTWQYLAFLFAVAGVNYLLATLIGFIHWLQEEEEEA